MGLPWHSHPDSFMTTFVSTMETFTDLAAWWPWRAAERRGEPPTWFCRTDHWRLPQPAVKRRQQLVLLVGAKGMKSGWKEQTSWCQYPLLKIEWNGASGTHRHDDMDVRMKNVGRVTDQQTVEETQCVDLHVRTGVLVTAKNNISPERSQSHFLRRNLENLPQIESAGPWKWPDNASQRAVWDVPEGKLDSGHYCRQVVGEGSGQHLHHLGEQAEAALPRLDALFPQLLVNSAHNLRDLTL